MQLIYFVKLKKMKTLSYYFIFILFTSCCEPLFFSKKIYISQIKNQESNFKKNEFTKSYLLSLMKFRTLVFKEIKSDVIEMTTIKIIIESYNFENGELNIAISTESKDYYFSSTIFTKSIIKKENNIDQEKLLTLIKLNPKFRPLKDSLLLSPNHNILTIIENKKKIKHHYW